MNTIWKFPLAVTDEQSVIMPEGAEILCAEVQHEQLCLWALVNPDAPKQRRIIEVFGTGHDMPDGCRKYIGTVQMMHGSLVWHVFENV